MMKDLNILFFTLLLALMPCRLPAADKTQYSWYVDKTAGMPPEQVLKMADDCADSGKEGEALVLYSVVANSYRDDMTDSEKNHCANARLKAGHVYWDRNSYAEALREYIAGVKISEACARPDYAASLYNSIGNVYCVFLEWEKGIDYYKKAYGYSRKFSSSKSVEHDILSNMTGMYTFLKDLPKARKYFRLSEQTKDTTNSVHVFLSGYMRSLLQKAEGNVAEGLAGLKRLASYAVEKGIEPKYQCFAYQEIYVGYWKIGVPDSTLKYMRLCDSTARNKGLLHTFAVTLKNLSKFYADHGEKAKSDMYKTQYLDIMDSLYDNRKFEATKDALFTYEVAKTTNEISDLKLRDAQRLQTIRVQRILMGAIVAVAVITVVFLLVVWRQKATLRRSYADLYSVNSNFIATQEQLTARLRAAGETIRRQEEQLEAARAEAGKSREAGEEPSKDQTKYKASNLSGEQAHKLAEAVRNVMENTTAFCDCNFTLDTLAELVGSNRTYVSQVINDTFHKSFNDYVNPYRIHLACARFSDTENYGNLTMKAVAESVGFKSYTSFINTFRKVTGITPKMYQQMAAMNKD